MTQLFGRFSAESSSHRVPGAAFVAAAALAMASFAIYSWVTRPAVVPIADGQLVNPWRVSSARGVRAARRVPP